MSSPSLPMVPQWLKLVFGVKRALGVLLAFEKLGKRNFGFDSLKYMNCAMPRGTIARQRAAGSRQRAVQSTPG